MVYSFSFKIITISNSFQFKISIQIILFYARIFLLKSNIPCGSISKINIQIVLYSIKIFFHTKLIFCVAQSPKIIFKSSWILIENVSHKSNILPGSIAKIYIQQNNPCFIHFSVV